MKLVIGCYSYIFIATLKQCARTLIFFIKMHSMRSVEATHEVDDGVLPDWLVFLVENKMEMVGHQTVGEDVE